jgi:hypothetical protein
MDNQHRKISGYRELSQEEIDLINRIKAFGPQLEELVNALETFVHSQPGDTPGNPLSWLYSGKFALQKGLMFLTRAIARPTFF